MDMQKITSLGAVEALLQLIAASSSSPETHDDVVIRSTDALLALCRGSDAACAKMIDVSSLPHASVRVALALEGVPQDLVSCDCGLPCGITVMASELKACLAGNGERAAARHIMELLSCLWANGIV